MSDEARRLNVYLTPECAARLDALREATGSSAAEIIRRGVAVLWAAHDEKSEVVLQNKKGHLIKLVLS